MNAPNILTLLRICSIPLIVMLLFYNGKVINFITAFIYLIASITDIIDGVIARRRNYTDITGKLLDPLADKLLLLACLVMLLYIGRINPIIVILLIGREISITGLRSIATLKNIVISASIHGKDKTILLSAGIVGLILGPYNHFIGISWYKIGNIVFLFGVVMSIYSAIEYIVKFYIALNKEEKY